LYLEGGVKHGVSTYIGAAGKPPKSLLIQLILFIRFARNFLHRKLKSTN
jgi:hypothetical protein